MNACVLFIYHLLFSVVVHLIGDENRADPRLAIGTYTATHISMKDVLQVSQILLYTEHDRSSEYLSLASVVNERLGPQISAEKKGEKEHKIAKVPGTNHRGSPPLKYPAFVTSSGPLRA